MPRRLSLLNRVGLRLLGVSSKDLNDPLTPGGGWEFVSGVLSGTKSNLDTVFSTFNQREKENMLRNCALIHACIQRYMGGVTKPSYDVYRYTDEGTEPVERHWTQRILRYPNALMTWCEFIPHCAAHVLVSGWSYVLKIRDRGNSISELWPVPTSWVTPVYSQGLAAPIGYKVWQGDNMPKAYVPAIDMIDQRWPDPTHPLRGLAKIDVVLKAYELETERKEHAGSLVKNVAPAGIVISKEEEIWTRDQKNAVVAAIMDKLGGARKYSPFFVGGKGAKFEPQVPLKDFAWKEFAALNHAEICTGLDVPPILVWTPIGLENSPWSNQQQAVKTFYRGPVSEMCSYLADGFTRGLLWEEDRVQALERTEFFRCDWSDVPEMQADANELAQRIREDWLNGLLTREEARIARGYAEKADGGYYNQYLAAQVVPADNYQDHSELEHGAMWEDV